MVVFARPALVAPVAAFVVLEIFGQLELTPPDYHGLTANLFIGVAIAALARAAALGVLAPDGRARRLVAFDAAPPNGSPRSWSGAAACSAPSSCCAPSIAPSALRRSIDDATRMLFAARSVGAGPFADRAARDDEGGSRGPPRLPGIRLLAWIAVACIAGALLAGYARNSRRY